MIDTLLQNRYRLDAELGHGGMGTVYRAHDTLLDRDVAVKVLNDTGLGTEGRARLLREAQAVAKLNHPNIVAVYDAGEVDAHALHRDGVGGRFLAARVPAVIHWTRRCGLLNNCAPRSIMLTRMASCIAI